MSCFKLKIRSHWGFILKVIDEDGVHYKFVCGFLLQEAQEMVLLKFKSELPPPVVISSAELSQLIKTNLHYPETYRHPFLQNRWDPHTHTH